jgi:hypothetical protein
LEESLLKFEETRGNNKTKQLEVTVPQFLISQVEKFNTSNYHFGERKVGAIRSSPSFEGN